MNPYDAPEVFAVIVLGTTVSPGKVTLSGHNRVPKWDEQAAKGSSGATTKLEDPKPPGKFTASFFLADADEVDAWDADFQPVLLSTFMGPSPLALPVYHPDLAANDFTEVVCRSIGGKVRDRTGGTTIAVELGEYCPPKPKPTRSAGGDRRTPQPFAPHSRGSGKSSRRARSPQRRCITGGAAG